MKKHFITFCLILFLCINSLSAQTPYWEWAKSARTEAYAIAICSDTFGYVYVTGAFSNSYIILGSDTLTNTNYNTGDIFVAKYDRAGNVIWAKSAGGAYDDYPRGICVDNAGNVIITGGYSSPLAHFDNITLTNAGTMQGDSSANIFVAKYDSSGNVIWAKTAGSQRYDQGTAVKVDNAGDIFLAGTLTSDSFNIGTTTLRDSNVILFGRKGANALWVKYDASGSVLWTKEAMNLYNNDPGVVSNIIATDANGNLFAGGYFVGQGFIFGSDTLFGGSMFLAKYDSQGNLLWLKGVNSANAFDLCTDNQNNVYITGSFYSSSITIGNYFLPNSRDSYDEIFIAKYNNSGNVIWARKDGGEGEDGGTGICTDNKGHIYLAGSFFADTISFGAHTISSPGNSFTNVFAAQYDTSGNPLWAISSSATDSNQSENIAGSNGITVDRDGKAYIVGAIYSSYLRFGNTTIANPYYRSVFFLAKIDSSSTNSIQNPTASKEEIVAYPNPSGSGKFYFKGIQPGDNIEISDILGQVFIRLKANKDSYLLDISEKNTGVYFYRIVDSKGQTYQGKILSE